MMRKKKKQKAGMTATMVGYIAYGRFDLGLVTNGLLAGLVSITAGCATIDGGYACLVGMVGGFVYCSASTILRRCRVTFFTKFTHNPLYTALHEGALYYV